MTLSGNSGTLAIGDHSTKVLSQRFGGAFALLSDLMALPAERRANSMVALVLSDGGLWFYDANSTEGHVPDDGAGSWLAVRTAQMLFPSALVFAVADLADADGFVESLATVTDPAVLTGEDLDGALVVEDPEETFTGLLRDGAVAFWPSVTADASVGAFAITENFEFIGMYDGEEVTRLAMLTDADGSETIIADGPLETLTTINLPAMADVDGALTFGFSGISPRLDANDNELPWTVVSSAADADIDTAAVHVGFDDGTDAVILLSKAQQLLAKPVRIYADTTAPITVYE